MSEAIDAIVELPWQSPELSPNKRMHWSKRSRITKQRRWDAMLCAKAAKLTARPGVLVVTMHYRPARNWRLDAGNLCLDLKAAVDGLVDARLVPDDTPEFVHTPEPIIHPAERGKPGALWLEITWEV
ncbi:hypothetical protein [Nocardia asiatica]